MYQLFLNVPIFECKKPHHSIHRKMMLHFAVLKKYKEQLSIHYIYTYILTSVILLLKA